MDGGVDFMHCQNDKRWIATRVEGVRSQYNNVKLVTKEVRRIEKYLQLLTLAFI